MNVCGYGPYRSLVNSAMDISHPGTGITMYNIPEIVASALLRAGTPEIYYQDFVLMRYEMYLKTRIYSLAIE